MFSGFGHLNTTVLIVGLVIISILISAYFFARKYFKFGKQNKAENDSKPDTQDNQQKQPEIKRYYCKCGELFNSNPERGKHFFKMGRKEPGKHGVLKEQDTVLKTDEYIVGTNEKYRCLVRRLPKTNQEPVIEYSKINKPLGILWLSDTSMPESGDCYYVKEVEPGKYVAYDPRNAVVKGGDTPHRAYMATHPQGVDGTWVYERSFAEMISNIVTIILIIATVIVVLVALSPKG